MQTTQTHVECAEGTTGFKNHKCVLLRKHDARFSGTTVLCLFMVIIL